jgi:hypothetical protein
MSREIKRILTLRCEESSFLTSESLDRELGRGEAVALAIHRLICRSCRRLKAQLLLLRQLSVCISLVDGQPLGERIRLSPQKRQAIQIALQRLVEGEQA